MGVQCAAEGRQQLAEQAGSLLELPYETLVSAIVTLGKGIGPPWGADQKDATKGAKLVNFLNWYLTKGADSARALDYAPLPDSVRDRVVKLVASIKVAK